MHLSIEYVRFAHVTTHVGMEKLKFELIVVDISGKLYFGETGNSRLKNTSICEITENTEIIMICYSKTFTIKISIIIYLKR